MFLNTWGRSSIFRTWSRIIRLFTIICTSLDFVAEVSTCFHSGLTWSLRRSFKKHNKRSFSKIRNLPNGQWCPLMFWYQNHHLVSFASSFIYHFKTSIESYACHLEVYIFLRCWKPEVGSLLFCIRISGHRWPRPEPLVSENKHLLCFLKDCLSAHGNLLWKLAVTSALPSIMLLSTIVYDRR